jgi:hypothetical protein
MPTATTARRTGRWIEGALVALPSVAPAPIKGVSPYPMACCAPPTTHAGFEVATPRKALAALTFPRGPRPSVSRRATGPPPSSAKPPPHERHSLRSRFRGDPGHTPHALDDARDGRG